MFILMMAQQLSPAELCVVDPIAVLLSSAYTVTDMNVVVVHLKACIICSLCVKFIHMLSSTNVRHRYACCFINYFRNGLFGAWALNGFALGLGMG